MTNPGLASPVQLDVRPVEADQIATPLFAEPVPIGQAVDGIRYDGFGNPVEYHLLRRHPAKHSMTTKRLTAAWDEDFLVRQSVEAIAYAVGHGLRVLYVTEDTTRAHPETVRQLYTTAIRAGAKRICVCDTVGHATPIGVRNLLHHVRAIVAELGAKGPGDMGKVMGAVKARLAGKADMGQVSAAVKAALAS